MTSSNKRSYRVLESVIREMMTKRPPLQIELPESFDAAPAAIDLYRNLSADTHSDSARQCAGLMGKVFDIQKDARNKGYASRAEYERAREYAQQVSDLAVKMGNVEKHNDLMNDSLRSIFDAMKLRGQDIESQDADPQDLPDDRTDKESVARDDSPDSLHRRSRVAQNKLKIIDNP